MAESAADAVDVLPPWELVPEQPPNRPARSRKRRAWFGDLLQQSWGPVRGQGLQPFVLAAVILGPASLLATGIEVWLDLPGSFAMLAVLMAGFFVYTIVLIGDGIEGQIRSEKSVASTLTHSDAAFSSIIAAGAVVGLLVAAGLHLRLLPGFLLLGLMALAAPAAARESVGGFTAARRGFILAQRNLLGHLALGVAVGALGAAVYVVAAFLFSPLPHFFDLLAAIMATSVVVAPFAAVTFAGAYDLRKRGGRLTVRPRGRSGALRFARATGQAVETTIAALAGQSARRRVAYLPTKPSTTGLPRYSPEAATMTVNRGSAHLRAQTTPGFDRATPIDYGMPIDEAPSLEDMSSLDNASPFDDAPSAL